MFWAAYSCMPCKIDRRFAEHFTVFAARRTTIRATVTAVDAGKPSVTFRGPEGRIQEVSVAQDPRILAQLKVGETYNVSYIEHLAMVVEKTAKR